MRPPRVAGLDVARALAIAGMIAAHVGNAPPSFEPLDPATWAGLVHGRSSLLFALVAGVSLALMTRGAATAAPDELRRTRLTLVGRGAVVFVLGLVLELLTTPVAIILCVYGAMFVAAAPLVGWSRRRLLTAAAVLGLAGPVVLAVLVAFGTTGGTGAQLTLFGTYPITVWLTFALVGMAVGRGDLRSAVLAGRLVAVGAVLTLVGYAGAALVPSAPDLDDPGASSVSSSAPDVVLVPGTEVDLDGMTCEVYGTEWVACTPDPGAAAEDEAAVGSADASSGRADGDSLLPGSSASVPGELTDEAWWLDGVSWDDVSWRDVLAQATSADPHTGGLGEVLGSGGFTLVVLGLCLLVGRPRVLRAVLVPVAALGSMPLTAYSLHVVAFLVPALATPSGLRTWALQVVGLALVTTTWALTRGRGPLEQLVRAGARRFAGPVPTATAPVAADDRGGDDEPGNGTVEPTARTTRPEEPR